MLTGGCFCGRVRYEAHGNPWHSTLCHCADCRRASGAPFVGWFTVKAADFRVVAGTPTTWESSPGVTRSFCADCGAQLSYQRDDHADEIDITTCSLDNPALIPPEDHTRAAERVPWIALHDGLPVHAGLRPEE
jgi:hypothetical protein